MTLSYEGEVYGVLDLVAVNSVELSDLLYRQAQFKAFWAQRGTQVIMGSVLVLALILLIWLLVIRKRRRPVGSAANRRGRYSGRRRY